MKYGIVVFCRESIFGIFAPISFLTKTNLQKAIKLLENGECSFVYVVVDHLDEKKKESADKYLEKYVSKVNVEIRSRIFVSASNLPYIKTLVEYLKHIPEDFCVDIFCRADEEAAIKNSIKIGMGVSGCNETDRTLIFRKGQKKC